MTTHDIPHRSRRTTLVVGASVALGLVVSVGLQLSGDGQPVVAAASAHSLGCHAVVAL